MGSLFRRLRFYSWVYRQPETDWRGVTTQLQPNRDPLRVRVRRNGILIITTVVRHRDFPVAGRAESG